MFLILGNIFFYLIRPDLLQINEITVMEGGTNEAVVFVMGAFKLRPPAASQ